MLLRMDRSALLTTMLRFVIGALLVNHALAEDFVDAADDEIIVYNKTSGSLSFQKSFYETGESIWQITPIPKNKTATIKINLFFGRLFLHENDTITVFKNINDTTSIIDPIRAQNGSVTIITDETTLFVKLKGTDKSYQRKFECYFNSLTCNIPITQDIKILHSPIYKGKESHVECTYTFAHDTHYREIPVFHFEVYNFTQSGVELEGTTNDGNYNNDPVTNFFLDKSYHSMSIKVSLKNMADYFRLLMHMVDSACSGYVLIDTNLHTIESPNYALDDGSFGNECVWVIKNKDSASVLGVSFARLDFTSVLDVVSINDGLSEISPPLLQVTTSSANHTMGQMVRSSGPHLWISFKPVSFSSKMVANITVHGQGGHFKGSGQISMKKTDGNDTIFMLEVEENEIVLLNFTSYDFSFPATLSIYDGFDTKNLLATLHGNVWYPVLSQSSRMMIIATAFSIGSFQANFKGISPGCLHMSSVSNDNYVLSGNCNSTCFWIIPPQNLPGSDLLLDLQYMSLDKEDTVEIHQLDAAKTLIGTVNSTVSHVPQVVVPADVGALVEITRKNCLKEKDVALIGHSSFLPACGGKIALTSAETFHVTSPLYPDTYPVLANCSWTLSAPEKSLVHLAFHKLALAPSHCVRIFNSRNNVTSELTGSQLPEDLFLSNGSAVHFYSSECKASKTSVQLVNSEGFMTNGTVAECGAVFEKQLTGEFDVNVTSSKQTLCMWKVNVPATNNNVKDSVNVISYTVTVKEDKGNYELKVFDGASVRENQIVNISTSEIWSRTNNLIFFYKRQNVSLPSSVFHIKYKVITCNSTMQCKNKICLHPDWKCNGINECGDFSDEERCSSVPIPPDVKLSGYSSTTFWVTVLIMMAVGALLGFGVPFFYQKYKNGQYHRFGDISVIE